MFVKQFCRQEGGECCVMGSSVLRDVPSLDMRPLFVFRIVTRAGLLQLAMSESSPNLRMPLLAKYYAYFISNEFLYDDRQLWESIESKSNGGASCVLALEDEVTAEGSHKEEEEEEEAEEEEEYEEEEEEDDEEEEEEVRLGSGSFRRQEYAFAVCSRIHPWPCW